MAIPRKYLIDSNKRGYYQITVRVVRRSMLCGYDDYTKKNYDYRKQWIKERLKFLTQYYFIDVGSYVVMSNHIHLVLRNRPDLEAKASDYEVVKRYLHVYTGVDARKEGRSEPTEEEINEILAKPNRVEEIRAKISNISSFMAALNEWVAKKANKEDGCKGRFWEGRFHSQYLVDQKAVLMSSAYVDLNPVRAFICKKPEDAKFTGFSDRIKTKNARDQVKEINHLKNEQGYLTSK